MVNIISSLGGGSGIDTKSLVEGLVSAERAGEDIRLDTKQEKLEAEISAYGSLKSALSTFQSLVSPLTQTDLFNARSVALPETNILTANSIAPGAQSGTYQLAVEKVASSHSLAFDAVADKNAPLSVSGTLSFNFGAWTYDVSENPDTFTVNTDIDAFEVEVETDDTLSSLADKINAADSEASASILEIDGQFQLVLNAKSGADNAIRITSDDASLVGFEYNSTNYAGVLETQSGVDALMYLNGLEVSRASNEISDVIPGLNFTLSKSAPDEILTFTIEDDSAAAEQAVRDFVAGYNELYTTVKGLTTFKENEETGEVEPGGLSTDASAKALFRQLRSVVGQAVPGLSSDYSALANVGILTELDGTLSIDEGIFSKSFSENFSQLEPLFARTIENANPYLDVTAGSYIGAAQTGSYAIEITTDPAKGYVEGSQIAIAGYDTGTDILAASFDASLNDYSFKIEVNGVESGLITLDGTYANTDEIASALQLLINSDQNLKDARSEVDVSFDTTTDAFTFTSRDYGALSTVAFTSATSFASQLGITTALVGVDGVDVVGTIDGVAAFGSGNILLPDLESPAYGLNITVLEGATGYGSPEVAYTRGFAGGLNKLLSSFLGNDGVISDREDTINQQLTQVDVDREELDRRMEKYETRISSQFLLMEQIISGLNTTKSSLDGILERLPFTASKN